MIQLPSSIYQVFMWFDEERTGAAAVEFACDSLEEAEAAFDAHVASGLYKSAVLMEYRAASESAYLVKLFPDVKSDETHA